MGDFEYMDMGLEFSDPVAVSKGGNDDILVSDPLNGRIVRYSNSGVFISQFYYNNPESELPSVIETDADGNIYVLKVFMDQSQSVIDVYSSSGTFMGIIGNNAGLSVCLGMAITPYMIFVTDFGNNNVKVLDTQGNLLGVFNALGSEHGRLSGPAGIMADNDGVIYITESNAQRVRMFDADGNYLGIFEEGLSVPFGIVRDNNGNVYVSDLAGWPVNKYMPCGTVPLPTFTPVTTPAP